MQYTYSISNPMAPPWFIYPYIRRSSIGWRMGSGEEYVYKFNHWYCKLKIDEQKQFQQMFPEPRGWLGWYKEEGTDRDTYDHEILLWHEDGEMKYSLDSIQRYYQGGKDLEYLFFSGHQPSKEGTITKSCLSQWWKSDFRIDVDKYSCMEQYMMAEKARLFKDNEALTKIMKSRNPLIMQEIGRNVKNFDEELWNKRRYSIVLNGNYAKFIQNEDLRQFLVRTKDAVLVEVSAHDRIWGIGMYNDESKENPFTWEGLNLLGFALMEVRDELIRVCQNYDKLDFEMLNYYKE